MTEILHEAPMDHPEHESTGVDNRKLGMWLFLSSEFLFFGALISNYLLYSNRPGFAGTYPSQIYDIPFTSVSSFVLLMSSLTMVLAHNALTREDINGTRTWLFATAALGSVFLGGQVFEFTEFIVNYDMTLSTNPAASAFYVLTGFHGTHVAIGVIMLLSLWGISRRPGGLSEKHGMNLELVGLYWHFVDIIWIVIFTVVYLLSVPPRMTPEHHHPTPAQYWKIAVLLAVLTAIEVAIYYVHLEFNLGNLNTISLIILATLKFVIVVAFYMHLRYEKSTLSRFFTGGFILAACLYTVVLAAMGVLVIRGS